MNATAQNIDKIIPQPERDRVREIFSSTLFERVADVSIVGHDDARRAIAFTFPATGAVKQKYGKEIFNVDFAEFNLSEGRNIPLDSNRSQILAAFTGGTLDKGCIRITVEYKTEAEYLTAKSAGTVRVLLKYRPTRWSYPNHTVTEIEVQRIAVESVSLLSPKFVAAVPRQRLGLVAAPIVQVRPITREAVEIDVANRVVEFDFCSNSPHERKEDAEPVCLDAAAGLQGLIGKDVLASRDGEVVGGSARLGKIQSARWSSLPIENAEGVTGWYNYARARIVFDTTPAGDKELAAWVAGEQRGAALTLKINRTFRELVKHDYLVRVTAWQPLGLAIEGGTVEVSTPEQPKVVQVPGKPGFFQRIASAIAA